MKAKPVSFKKTVLKTTLQRWKFMSPSSLTRMIPFTGGLNLRKIVLNGKLSQEKKSDKPGRDIYSHAPKFYGK